MPLEIEHKYLVANDDWKDEDIVNTFKIKQAYLTTSRVTTRIRLINDESAKITIKIPHCDPSACHEFEYDIPYDEGVEMFNLSEYRISKTRYVLLEGWEVDVFEDQHEGLVLAELEIPQIGIKFNIPDWVGEEVTQDFRYRNVSLAVHVDL